MKRRGRQFLTRFFMLVMVGTIASILAGSAYFLLSSAFSVERLLVIPIVMVGADITYRLYASNNVSTPANRVMERTRLNLLISTTAKTISTPVSRLPIRRVALAPYRVFRAVWP